MGTLKFINLFLHHCRQNDQTQYRVHPKHLVVGHQVDSVMEVLRISRLLAKGGEQVGTISHQSCAHRCIPRNPITKNTPGE